MKKFRDDVTADHMLFATEYPLEYLGYDLTLGQEESGLWWVDARRTDGGCLEIHRIENYESRDNALVVMFVKAMRSNGYVLDSNGLPRFIRGETIDALLILLIANQAEHSTFFAVQRIEKLRQKDDELHKRMEEHLCPPDRRARLDAKYFEVET